MARNLCSEITSPWIIDDDAIAIKRSRQPTCRDLRAEWRRDETSFVRGICDTLQDRKDNRRANDKSVKRPREGNRARRDGPRLTNALCEKKRAAQYRARCNYAI